MFNDLYEVGTPEYKQCIINKGPKKLIEEQKLKEKLNEKKTAEVEKKRLEQKKLEAQKKAEEEKKLLEQEKLDAQKRAEEEKKRLEEEKLDAQKKAEISKYPLLIENIKFSLGEDVSDTKKLNYVFTVENRTNDKRLKFYACIEFLDKMNLNIFEEQGKNMSIGPADKKIYSDTKRVIENDNWDETTVLKVYLRQFGCASSSDEFSKPLEFKVENGKIYNSKKEMILDSNISKNYSSSNSNSNLSGSLTSLTKKEKFYPWCIGWIGRKAAKEGKNSLTSNELKLLELPVVNKIHKRLDKYKGNDFKGSDKIENNFDKNLVKEFMLGFLTYNEIHSQNTGSMFKAKVTMAEMKCMVY